MKRVIATILSIMVLVSCGDDNASDPNRTKIYTIGEHDTDLFKKTVILYEDDRYVISTYFDKYISSYPYGVLPGYDELKQKAIQDTVTQDTLKAKDYVTSNGDATYILAYHLENGSCLIYDKNLHVIIKTVEMEKFSSGGPMSTIAGRKFYIVEQLFLDVVDMMS